MYLQFVLYNLGVITDADLFHLIDARALCVWVSLSLRFLLFAGSTVPLPSTALVRAWSMGSGWVIYVGAGILPEDRVFGRGGRPPIDKQV